MISVDIIRGNMLTTNEFCKKEYGEKLYKLALSGGFTCPNRDGKLGTGGCIFCSAGGSGDFAEDPSLSVDEQIERAKERVSSKFKGNRYIAYFQSFTNTYAPLERLRTLYDAVASREDVAVISIATRPDCLPEDVLSYLGELSGRKPVWVELGLQTVKEESIGYIRRGYDTAVYDEAVKKLNALGIHTITHVILGLPGETKEDMLKTVRHVCDAGSKGIKLQLLHVLEETDLAEDYRKGKFRTLEMDEYIGILMDCLRVLPEDTVVHRLTGDGPKKILIAPLWSANKRAVLNAVNRAMKNSGL